jgi:hypothetical protein
MEQTIWQEYQDDGVVVWGINFVEQREVVEEFVENFGLTFPILLDTSGFVYSRYLEVGLCATPFPLDNIVDPDGLIAYRSCEYFPDSMTTVIEEILEGGEGPHARFHEEMARGTRAERAMHATRAAQDAFPRIESIQPNPIRDWGSIRFGLPSEGHARVDILDLSGRLFRRLFNGPRQAGPHVVVWDGRDAEGRPASAGLYLIRVTSTGRTSSRKVLLIR